MKHANGLLSALVAGLTAAPSLPGAHKRHHFLAIFLGAVLGIAALVTISPLLPDKLAQLTQDGVCWLLVGAVAALGLLATVKGLEGLLDA